MKNTGPETPDQTSPGAGANTAVEAELVAMLYVSLAPVVFITLAGTLVYAAMAFWENDYVFGLFSAAIFITGLYRIINIHAYRRTMDAGSTRRWEKLHAAGSLGFALVIGLSGAHSFWHDDAQVHTFAIALLYGYCTGVITRIFSRPWIAIPTLLLAVMPYVVALAVSGSPLYQGLGLFTLLMSLTGIEIIKTSHRMTLDLIRTRHRLASLASKDGLTGLANRMQFEHDLNQILADETHDNERNIALYFIDLDHFKQANDTFGHPVGDGILKEVGRRLKFLLPAHAFAARFGGDEFVIVQAQAMNKAAAEKFGLDIVEALSRPYHVLDVDVSIGASVGIAVFDRPGAHSVPEMMETADRALYAAKRKGRGTVELNWPEYTRAA
jgi:diguanylate cyclase